MSQDRWGGIRQARDYRAFLRAYLEARGITLSDLARAAGFGRGFPGDVISGKRRLTSKSSYAFHKALKAPAPARLLFRLLVALEEGDLFPELDRESLPAQIASLREKKWENPRRTVRETERPSYARLLEDPRVAVIYAAAGAPGEGATMAQLRGRTGLGDVELSAFAEKSVAAGLLEKSGERFVPRELHLFMESGAENDILVAHFKRACRVAGERVTTRARSAKEFFFSSAFCVREENLPALKEALRETVLKFVDEAIEPHGDRVVQLLTSLYSAD